MAHESTYQPLTSTFARDAAAPIDRRLATFWDDEIRGFGLQVTDRGAKSWVLNYVLPRTAKTKRLVIGRFPDLHINKAREIVLQWRALVAEGKDPAQTRNGDGLTFGDFSKRFLDEYSKPRRKTWKRDEERLHHFDRWKTKRLIDISRDAVVRLQHELSSERGPVMANRTVQLLKTMFGVAADWGVFEGPNPVTKLKLYTEHSRERFLSPAELKRVNEVLVADPNPYWRAYFPLVLLLGPRKNELLGAKWAEFDLSEKVWKKPTTKSGRSHVLPLPEMAVRLLESIPRGESEYVFPGSGSSGHLTNAGPKWNTLRKAAKVEDVTIHDLRRTLGSWLAGRGVSDPIIGKAIGDTSSAAIRIYARLNLEPVRLELEANAKQMFGAGAAPALPKLAKRPRLRPRPEVAKPA